MYYPVDYRNATSNNLESSDTQLFNEIVIDLGAEPLQVGNDLGKPRGRTSNAGRSSCNLCIALRNQFTNALQAHDMHMSYRDE